MKLSEFLETSFGKNFKRSDESYKNLNLKKYYKLMDHTRSDPHDSYLNKNYAKHHIIGPLVGLLIVFDRYSPFLFLLSD
jgi:hypothetical protein